MSFSISSDKGDCFPELLAPAGTLISLLAAVSNGADAVYMGASRFGARAYAGNFSDFELAAGIDYAHAFGKKVYVTLNTLYKDDELPFVLSLFDSLYQHGVDSVIVQDLGLLFKINEKYPDFAVHASTQMTVHNSYHASFLQKRGVSRIVPARENSIPELIEIKKTGVEVEVFIHGALCICYSGQCFFSSFVGSRSGNRGKCAQPCRKRYKFLMNGQPFESDGQYLLSPKDLNASENLEKLISAGMDSFKIEGRMKKPEYVAGVVSVYRNLINRILEKIRFKNSIEETEFANFDPSPFEISRFKSNILPTASEKETLKKLFNRDFTEGYFIQNPQNELMSRKLPYNKGIFIGKIESVNRKSQKVKVLLCSDLAAHDGISIGDLGKNMDSTQDPRFGFTVKKMFVGNNICSSARSGDIVELSLPANDGQNNISLPSVGDSVYKTFDFELQRQISKTFPKMFEGDDDSQMQDLICSIYSNLSSHSSETKSKRHSVYSSSDIFPISEMVEKLSPNESLQIPVALTCQIQIGHALRIVASDLSGNLATVFSEYIVEPAQKNPLTMENASDMLFKLGNTIYQTISVEVDLVGDCFVPVGEFKNTRNKALQALLNERVLQKRRAPIESVLIGANVSKNDLIDSKNDLIDSKNDLIDSKNDLIDSKNDLIDSKNDLIGSKQTFSDSSKFDPMVSVLVYSKDGLKAALDAGADRVYVGGEVFIDPLTQIEYGISVSQLIEIAAESDDEVRSKIFFKTPMITKEEDFALLRIDFKSLFKAGIRNVLVSNAGVYEFLISTPEFSNQWNIALGESFNIFNSAAVLNFTDSNCFFESDSESFSNSFVPLSSILLSSELSVSEIEILVQNLKRQNKMFFPLECLVHGRQRLMVTEHPLLQSLFAPVFDKMQKSTSDPLLFSNYSLKDVKNYVFPIYADLNGRNHLFNSKILNVSDLVLKLNEIGVSVFKIDTIGFSADEIFSVVSSYKNILYLNDAPQNTSSPDSEFTRGNFIRGTD